MEMISASRRCASSMPSWVLPDAVGPVSTREFWNGGGSMDRQNRVDFLEDEGYHLLGGQTFLSAWQTGMSVETPHASSLYRHVRNRSSDCRFVRLFDQAKKSRA